MRPRDGRLRFCGHPLRYRSVLGSLFADCGRVRCGYILLGYRPNSECGRGRLCHCGHRVLFRLFCHLRFSPNAACKEQYRYGVLSGRLVSIQKRDRRATPLRRTQAVQRWSLRWMDCVHAVLLRLRQAPSRGPLEDIMVLDARGRGRWRGLLQPPQGLWGCKDPLQAYRGKHLAMDGTTRL